MYLEQFQYRASQISTLQHPYILPLLDFGIYRDFPYLVSPHLPLRSLHARIAKNGTLNTFTVGRYLDQIATALEYAHEHAVIHGGLSVNSTFIRLDGQLVVADVGVRSLLELSRQDLSSNQLLEWSEGFAPEQLLGKPASPATDVYALGAVVYHLLTGTPVFEASTLDELVQLHVYASIPPLTGGRSDLPPGLFSVLARALAKDPTQRYHQPGAFANAYHNATGPLNRTRVPFVVASETPRLQAHQPHGTGLPLADTPFTEHAWSNNGSTLTGQASTSPGSTIPSSMPHSQHGFSDEKHLSMTDAPRPSLMRRFGRRDRQRILLIASLVVLVVIASSAAGITFLVQKSTASSSASGQVTFFANQQDPSGLTNSLHITIQQLGAPAAGQDYQAWFINDQTEQILALGRLVEKGQSWSLTFSGASTNLLAVGDTLEVTQEQGTVNAPAGQVMLTGTFPTKAFQHIPHLLVSYPPTPGKVALLVGMVQQTHLLDSQATVLQSVANTRDTAAMRCVIQSMLDSIEGTHGSHYQPLAGLCAQQKATAGGDGFGLLGRGYVAGAEQHAALALKQPDATSLMHQHAALMDRAIANITGWMTTIEQDLLRLRTNPGDLSSLAEMTILADNAYHGVDTNGDGQIDPVPGEAGALTAYLQGPLMATLTLAPST